MQPNSEPKMSTCVQSTDITQMHCWWQYGQRINDFKLKTMIKKEMFEDMPVIMISSIIALVILFLIFILIDGIFSKPVYFSGIVVDKQYKAESTRTGTGVGTTSNGQTGVVVTTEIDPEKFLVMVKTESGKILTADCEPEIYYAKKEGQPIECYWSKGLFTGWNWSVHGVR